MLSTYSKKNPAKFPIVEFFFKTQHETHLLKLLDKVYEYKMDPTIIGEDTEQTQICPHPDGQTEMEKLKPIPPKHSVVRGV